MCYCSNIFKKTTAKHTLTFSVTHNKKQYYIVQAKLCVSETKWNFLCRINKGVNITKE